MATWLGLDGVVAVGPRPTRQGSRASPGRGAEPVTDATGDQETVGRRVTSQRDVRRARPVRAGTVGVTGAPVSIAAHAAVGHPGDGRLLDRRAGNAGAAGLLVEAQRPGRAAGDVAVPVARHRTRGEQAVPSRLATGHGDRRDPVRRPDHAAVVLHRDRDAGRLADRRAAHEHRALHQGHRELPQRHVRVRHRRPRSHRGLQRPRRRGPAVHRRSAGQRRGAVGGRARRAAAAVLGDAVHVLPRRRRAAPASGDLQPARPGAPGAGAADLGAGGHEDRRVPLLAGAVGAAVDDLPLDRVPVDRHRGTDRRWPCGSGSSASSCPSSVRTSPVCCRC